MKITLITGAARSGTSMVAGCIDKCGAFGGITSPPNPNNKKGMFENSDIRGKVVKSYLRRHGFDPKAQWPIPVNLNEIAPFPALRRRVLEILETQGWDGEQPLYYKGAKMCLLWPIWVRAFPEAQWIIVRRPDEQIIDSCKRTFFMNRYNNAEGWQGWIDIHKQRWEEMYITGLKIKEVWSTEVVKDPLVMKDVVQWAGLQFNEEAVRDFIEPKLFNKGL